MVPVNYWAILVCGVASMILGFLWYGPLFGKMWMGYMGIDPSEMEKMRNDPAAKRAMYRSYLLAFIGALLMAFVLAHALIFAASYMNVSGVSAGLQAAFWNWLGFIAPVTLGGVLWERKPWGWWILMNAYYLVQLIIMGLILALWV